LIQNEPMFDIAISGTDGLEGPPCRTRGGKTRLFGTESHPLIGQLRVLSYVCLDCDAVRVDMALLRRAREQLSVSPEGGSYADGQASH
jgi:hypothetical protein